MRKEDVLIFLDLDDTLLSDSSLMSNFRKMLEPYGISREVFHATYKEVKDRNSGVYNPCEHLNTLLDKHATKKFSASTMYHAHIQEAQEHLYDDVEEFLEKFPKGSLIILSFGNKEYQTEKIASTGLASKVSEVVVTDANKGAVIHAYLQRHNTKNAPRVVFIDDKIEHLRECRSYNPNVKLILMCRSGNRECVYEGAHKYSSVTNLGDAFSLIKRGLQV